MLDRTIAPEFQIPDKVELIKSEFQQLDNGIPVFMVNAGHQEVVRLEFIFSAGSWYENANGEAYFTLKMLGEGTLKHSAKEIEDIIAQYGAFLDLESGLDRVKIVLYSLNKHLASLLPLVLEIVTEPAFSSSEFKNLAHITSQNLKVNMEKTSYVASRTFRAAVFGENHPYGRFLKEGDIDNVKVDHLNGYFNDFYRTSNCVIVISGLIGENVLSALNRSFGLLAPSKVISGKQSPQFLYKASSKTIEKSDSLQSSIRLGLPSVGLSHPDYFKVNLAIEILGGYFGSRLMKNIREEKGYTYGISSSHVAMQNGAFLVIGTDVKKEFTSDTIAEVHKEIKKLQSEKVSEEELTNVKNYLIGSFLNSINTPFALADRFKMIYFHDLGYEFYDQYMDSLKNICAEDVLETTRQYLSIESLTEVVVGGK
ncbi:MAG: M16 family metallopeptidase [Cytophagaceae bacterium]